MLWHTCSTAVSKHPSHRNNWRNRQNAQLCRDFPALIQPDLHPPLSLSFPAHFTLKLMGSHSALFWWNQKGIRSKFPYKASSWTGSSLQLNICWVSCPSRGFRLKQDGLRKTPTPPTCSPTHTHTPPPPSSPPQILPLLQMYTQWKKTEKQMQMIQNPISRPARCALSYISLEHMRKHSHAKVTQTRAPLTHREPLTVRHGHRGSGQRLPSSVRCKQLIASSLFVPPSMCGPTLCFLLLSLRLFHSKTLYRLVCFHSLPLAPNLASGP